MTAIDHYTVKLRRPGQPVDRDVIAAAERELAVAFPQPYVDFLLQNNGGAPSPAYLPYPGDATKVERFYSIEETGLVHICRQHRAKNGLASTMLPIAELGGGESVLLLECGGDNVGALYFWIKPAKFGFRYDDPDYSNVGRLYFDIAELFLKFGPAKNRKDRDGMFCQLYYSSTNPAHGGKLATKYVEAGYDINFVLPTFGHPIFGAISGDTFGVAVTMLELGTHTTHTDPLREDATIEELLVAEQERWEGLLEVSRANNYDTGKGMATRRLADIASALALVKAATR